MPRIAHRDALPATFCTLVCAVPSRRPTPLPDVLSAIKPGAPRFAADGAKFHGKPRRPGPSAPEDRQGDNIVHSHHHHQHQHQRDSGAIGPLGRLRPHRLATDRLGRIEHQVPSIERRDWQEVDECQIKRDQRGKMDERRRTHAHLLTGEFRDLERAAQFLDRSIPGQDLLDAGAWNTLSFGPALMDDGQIVQNLARVEIDTNLGNHPIQGEQPRTGVGIIAPNHFVFIVVDGRSDGYSRGVTLDEFAQIFQQLGCTEAYNLDGGGSSTMVFMDRVINNPLGRGNERATSDILYIAAE